MPTRLSINRKIALGGLVLMMSFSPIVQTAVPPLADAPVNSVLQVPANVGLLASYEFPTWVVPAYRDADNFTTCMRDDQGLFGAFGRCYFESGVVGSVYLGLFDPRKCYAYNAAGYFYPVSIVGVINSSNPDIMDVPTRCGGNWSGNFLNWAAVAANDVVRQVLTGGNRYVDTVGETILERSKILIPGQLPIDWGFYVIAGKRISSAAQVITPVTIPAVNPGDVTPYVAWNDLYLGHNGIQMKVAPDPDIANAGANDTYYVRVKVCDPAVGVESNCKMYSPTNYKPEGLIQRFPDRLRWSVFSYLADGRFSVVDAPGYHNDDGTNERRSGAILRSRMKSTGPTWFNDATLAIEDNPRKEWDPATGIFIANPEANGPYNDAATTAALVGGPINFSGVVMSINKGGTALAGTEYSTYDRPGGMMYEYIRSLQNDGTYNPTPEFVALTPGPYHTPHTLSDGLPIITNWTGDPAVKFRCQKNFSILVGDINSWCDTKVPGSTVGPWACAGHTTPLVDPAIDATTLLTAMSAVEGVDLNTTPGDGGHGYATTRGITYGLGALAWYANSNDLRPDISDAYFKVSNTHYSIDVLEDSNWYTAVNPPGTDPKFVKTHYYLAAKYGGGKGLQFFPDGSGFDAQGVPIGWDSATAGAPNNWFAANNPRQLQNSLTSVVNNIISLSAAGAGVGVSTSSFAASSNNEGIYAVSFNSANWTGDVVGSKVDSINPATGVFVLDRRWSARNELNALVSGTGWDTNRKIATGQWNGASFTSIAFRWANLNAAQQTALALQEVNYLRGDRSNEAPLGLDFRPREHMLGDIVDSEAVFVDSKPDSRLANEFNPGYKAFVDTFTTTPRRQAIYFGANDGMLHAVDARTDAPGAVTGLERGGELWAYIPSMLYEGPSTPATPQTDGLRALTNASYNHRYYVNATPFVWDVDFFCTAPVTGPCSTFSSEASAQWRTILVGGLGKGGKGYYAIDITNPLAADEAVVAGKILWEFNDPDLGFTYGKAAIMKTRKWGWVVAFGSGYNNLTGPNPGKGFLYIVNAGTGQLLLKAPTGEGTPNEPLGLAFISGYTPNSADHTADAVYAGDFRGNVWRFDLRSTSDAVYTDPTQYITKIAVLKDSAGIVQPVTTEPEIITEPNTNKRYIFIGTGKLLDPSDINDPQVQTMYAIRDGSRTEHYTTSTLPSGVSFPFDMRAKAISVSDAQLVTGIDPNDATRPMGWFHDLTGVSGAAKERVVLDPDAFENTISWFGTIPENQDPCQPAGSGRQYAVQLANARTRLYNTSITVDPQPYIPLPQAVVKAQIVRVGSQTYTFGTDIQTAEPKLTSKALNIYRPGSRLINIREISGTVQ